MEYFDQFPGEDITPAGGFASDPEKDEEELDEMIRQQQQQAAPQEEQQPAPEAEAPAAEAEAPVEDQPQEGWMDQLTGAAVGRVADLVDNVFQGDQKSYEEIRQGMREATAKREEERMANPVTAVLDETERALEGGYAGVIEQPVRFAQQIVGQDATFNLGIAENKTAVGEFARSTITMLGLMKGAAGAGVKVGGGASVASRLATETARGAVADFIMEEGDGNLSNLLGEMNPELEDTFLTALAHEDDDNIYIRKLKNMAEGGVFGAAVDGLGEAIGLLRAGLKARGSGRKAVLEAIEAKQLELDLDAPEGKAPRKDKRVDGILVESTEGPRDPGFRDRVKESVDNNAASVETNLYEPNERAAITSGTTPTDAAQSLIKAGDSTNAKRMATDETFRKIITAPDAETGLQEVVKAVADNLDIDAIYDSLRAANNGKQEWVLESIPVIEEFLENSRGANDFSSLQQLLTKADGQVVKQYMTDEGALAVRVLAKDTANQISDIARNIQDVDSVSGDTYRQAEMLLDRLEALSKMNIEASYKAGSQLQRRNASKFNIRKILGEGDGDAALKQAKSDETITKLREALADGDPQAKADFQTLADAVALVDGNPEKIMSFWQKWRTVGAAGLRTAMYNGYLSATQSQIRNLIGNEFNIMLRPATQAIGFAAQGVTQAFKGKGAQAASSFTEARIQLAAYHGLLEMHGEAFKIFKKSFADSAEDTSQVVRFDEGQPGTGRQLVENMKASAETQGERAAAEMVDMYYSIFNNPMMRMPTRGLQAADDAARTLIARMELKKDAMRNSFEKGQGFKVDADRYAKLVDMKIDGEGNLLDQRLLDTAKEVTFQEDLSGFGKTLQDLSNGNPAVKLMFPFVKTPMNIMRQTASYIPGVHQRFIKDFQDAVDAGDVEKIAMYKGREAIGFMTMASAAGLAINGLVTGKGPQDKQKRELWLKNNQPNSIKTPAGWVSYETIEPLNTILSASVDLLQLAAAGNQSAYDKSFAQFSYSLAAAVVDKSYLKGLLDTASLIDVNDPRWLDLAAAKVAQTGNTVLLPLSGARAQLSRALQPGKQEFDNVWQREMQRALPSTQRLFGVDRVDILENKQMQFGDYATNLWNTLTPFDVTNDNPDSVAKQLGELGVDITLSFSDTFKGIDLTARETQQFNQYLADTGIGKELKSLLANEKFQADVEAWKESGKGQDPAPQWLTLIHSELRRAKREARSAMLAENPTFADKVELNQVQADLIKQGRYNQEPAEKIQQQLKFILEY